MVITLVILAYIASIFISRWFNYLAHKRDKWISPEWGLWFAPGFNLIFTGLILISILIKTRGNWFTGKNW